MLPQKKTEVVNPGPSSIGQSPGMAKYGSQPICGTVVPNRIFVGGFDSFTTEIELGNIFSAYGKVKATKIIGSGADKCGGSGKCYGFVTYETEEEAQRLTNECEKIILRDRKLNIAPAIKRFRTSSTGSKSITSTDNVSTPCHSVANSGQQLSGSNPTRLATPTLSSGYQLQGQIASQFQQVHGVPTISVQPHFQQSHPQMTAIQPQQPQYYYQPQPSFYAYLPQIKSSEDMLFENNIAVAFSGMPPPQSAYIYSGHLDNTAGGYNMVDSHHNIKYVGQVCGYSAVQSPPVVQPIPQYVYNQECTDTPKNNCMREENEKSVVIKPSVSSDKTVTATEPQVAVIKKNEAFLQTISPAALIHKFKKNRRGIQWNRRKLFDKKAGRCAGSVSPTAEKNFQFFNSLANKTTTPLIHQQGSNDGDVCQPPAKTKLTSQDDTSKVEGSEVVRSLYDDEVAVDVNENIIDKEETLEISMTELKLADKGQTYTGGHLAGINQNVCPYPSYMSAGSAWKYGPWQQAMLYPGYYQPPFQPQAYGYPPIYNYYYQNPFIFNNVDIKAFKGDCLYSNGIYTQQPQYFNVPRNDYKGNVASDAVFGTYDANNLIHSQFHSDNSFETGYASNTSNLEQICTPEICDVHYEGNNAI